MRAQQSQLIKVASPIFSLQLSEALMSRVQIRVFTLLGLIGSLIGSLMFLAGALIGAPTVTDATGVHVTALGNPALFVAGIVVTLTAAILAVIAWIFALIRTAERQRWGWFVTMLVFGGIVTLIWSFVGPDAPAP
jgi:hypothetical protein